MGTLDQLAEIIEGQQKFWLKLNNGKFFACATYCQKFYLRNNKNRFHFV